MFKRILTLYVLLMWSLVIAILFAGFWLTKMNVMGLEWFSRSGSVVVILGIISGLGGVVQEQILLSQLALQQRFTLLKTRKKLRLMHAPPDYREKELLDVNAQFDAKADALQSKLKIRAGLLELTLLVIGTFVWGFGDILMILGR